MGWAHPVAAVIEDAAGQDSGRCLEPKSAFNRTSCQLGLHGLEDGPFHDRVMLGAIKLAAVGDLADIKAVLEQVGERPDAKTEPTDHVPFCPRSPFGPDAGA